ncbi:MAG: hypothetical protein HYX59_08015 [Elusimicrobia bacterium]|nr:hypothetical protein [Elusimicrobiota bacterium]
MSTLELTFRLATSDKERSTSIDLSTIGETPLRYDLFLGDITFKVGNCDFSTNWGWVPIIDFMACMKSVIVGLLNDQRLAHFEFTESDAKITFRNSGSMIRIASTYADGSCEVPLEEFIRTVNSESHRLRNELLAKHPGLLANPAFNELLASTAAPK